MLYATVLFRATFKVMSTGVVEMENTQPIAAGLPVRVRRYEGIFRTPLCETPAG